MSKKKALKQEVKALLEEVQAADSEAARFESDREDLLELLALQAHQAKVTQGLLNVHLRRFAVSVE